MSEPFNPQDFGWQVDLPGRAWILRRRSEPPLVVGTLTYFEYYTPFYKLRLNDTGELETVYRGAIPDADFARLLFAQIMAGLDPEEDAHIIEALAGNKTGSDLSLPSA